MTTANLAFFSNGKPEAEILDHVDSIERKAYFYRFTRFVMASTGEHAIYGIVAKHSPDTDTVRLFLVHQPTGTQENICEIPDGEAVILYPGPKSEKVKYPRLEVSHGENCAEPKTINIVEVLSGRYG